MEKHPSTSFHIFNETAPLQTVIVGRGNDTGPTLYHNNPKIAAHAAAGTLPEAAVLVAEVDNLAQTLHHLGVTVHRPVNQTDLLQIFSRDIAFVVGETLVQARMMKANRRPEFDALHAVLNKHNVASIITPPEDAFVEGGDVIVHHPYLFVGLSARTNEAGVAFLQKHFPDWEVITLPLTVTDDARTNILHLDCAFQPVAEQAIIYEAGFRTRPDAIYDIFGATNLIPVTAAEMYDMVPNIFSVTPETVISETGFGRLNGLLQQQGLNVISIPYANVAKLGGLLRCSTLPLQRF